MSDLITAVMIVAYLYIVMKGHPCRINLWFALGVLALLCVFVGRAIIAGNARDISTVEGATAFIEVCLGISFLGLVLAVPMKNIDRKASNEVKNVLGNALHKAAENAKKSDTNEDSTS